jgi:hypothetical protein
MQPQPARHHMTDLSEIGQRNLKLLRELRGHVCICGSQKQARQTFCRGCYFRLPAILQKALYKRLGNGYAEAYAEARKLLEGEQNAGRI